MIAARNSFRHARSATAALAVAIAVLTTSCTAAPLDEPSPSASTESPAPDADESAEDEIATATAELEKGTVDVIVRSLEVDDGGETMTLRAAFIPHLGEADEPYTLSKMNDFFFLHPVLLDRRNLKRYSVIEGQGSQNWLTNEDAEAADGKPVESWFVYAAPEDSIESITFTIDQWSIELPDIPIGGMK